MSFEKTKAATEGHTPEEVAEEFKGETPEGDAQPSNQEPEMTLEEKLAKAEEDRDNYKRGLLSLKNRSLELPETPKETPKETPEPKKEEPKATPDVESVLDKRNEKVALRMVVDSSSKHYIPELEDEANFNQVLNYIPRSIDRTTPESIIKALNLATKMWKEDKGIKSSKPSPSADLSATNSQTASDGVSPGKKEGRKLLKKSTPMTEWY